jgi:hypothetical protein
MMIAYGQPGKLMLFLTRGILARLFWVQVRKVPRWIGAPHEHWHHLCRRVRSVAESGFGN